MDKKTEQENNLKQAQQGLEFDDIYQKQTQASIAEGFEPKYALRGENQEISIQFKHSVLNSQVLRVTIEGENKIIFRVNIVVGIRYVQKNEDANKQNEKPVAQIETMYSVDYRLIEKSLLDNQDALNEFALKNASYHLWPFWREFAMAQAQRMSLPPVPLPMRMPQ